MDIENTVDRNILEFMDIYNLHKEKCCHLLGSLTAVSWLSPPQWRWTWVERAGPFQQVCPPVNFILACLDIVGVNQKHLLL